METRGTGTGTSTETTDEIGEDIVARLVHRLGTTRSGIAFIYDALDDVLDAWHLDDAVLVVDDPELGRQVFRGGRRPFDEGWSQWAATAASPGLHTDPTVVEATDPLWAVHDLCAVALRVDRLQYDSTHDSLTGLTNRRGFDEQLVQAIGRSQRYGWRFSLVLLDLNHFKRVNDRFGHAAGDAVLREVGQRLRGGLREGDVAARIGGDEFALILPMTDEQSLPSLLERLYGSFGSVPDVELAAGAASCPHDADTVEGLYALADERLYAAKQR